MVSVRQVQVTFDCAEPERVARFWCEVLGYVIPPPPTGFATWDGFDRALPPEDRARSLRALIPPVSVRGCSFNAFPKPRSSRILADEHNESCLVMQDVEGNESCLD